VPSFVFAFVVGEGLTSALGRPNAGDEQAPESTALIAVVPALVVFAVTAGFAVWFGRRGVGLDDPWGGSR
jgi:hypothetical protein